MPTIDNWRALREALDALRRIESLHDCDWQSREGDVNEWGTQCYEIDFVFYGVDELATAYDPETAAYIAAAHPAAIRSLLDERDRLAAEAQHAADVAEAYKAQAESLAADVERLKTLAVTKIMLDVVPGEDGMGKEVFAQSVEDVESLLTKMGEKLESSAAEVEALRAEVNRAVRGSLLVSDCLHHQILAMRAAAVAGELESPERGMQWIVNTLAGPGNLPDLDEARAIGGAQAMFDKEMAEHEAFREAHPAPPLDAAMKSKP